MLGMKKDKTKAAWYFVTAANRVWHMLCAVLVILRVMASQTRLPQTCIKPRNCGRRHLLFVIFRKLHMKWVYDWGWGRVGLLSLVRLLSGMELLKIAIWVVIVLVTRREDDTET